MRRVTVTIPDKLEAEPDRFISQQPAQELEPILSPTHPPVPLTKGETGG